MTTYYMGEDVHRDMTIVGESGIPSDYQDLIDDYLAGGGMIHKIEEGERDESFRVDRGFSGQSKPNMSPDQWDNYFDMNHLAVGFGGMSGKVNKIKKQAGY